VWCKRLGSGRIKRTCKPGQTGSLNARVMVAFYAILPAIRLINTCILQARTVENTTLPDYPGFQDFGEVVLYSPKGRGYVRVDWFTPNGMPTWGDGRLFIQGTEGQIELRKYTDVGRPHATNTLILTNGDKNELIDCNGAGLPYFARLIADVHNRSETAMPQAHAFKVMELAIKAQAKAEA